MSDRVRCYAWIAGAQGSTAPDRSHLLKQVVSHEGDVPFPEKRTWMGAFAEEDDGDGRAELIYWYGSPESLDREAAEENGLEVLSSGTGEWPAPPEGWSRTSR